MPSEPADDVEYEVQTERAPFEQIPTALWMGGTKAGACSPQAVQAYLVLRQSGAEAGWSITRKNLAAKVGKSPRTVDGWIDELVQKGWLLKTPRFRPSGDQQQTSNRYLVLWDQLTGPDDPRYVRHLAQVALFEREMQSRRAANAAAAAVEDDDTREPDPLAENCYPPSQDPARAPSQKTATQDPDLLFPDSSTHTRAAAAPAARDKPAGDPALVPVRSVPRATATEPKPESSDDDVEVPGRRLDRCTRPEHQTQAWPEACRGCMHARRAWLRAQELRDIRIVEALENSPDCDHGEPGGDRPHPADPDGPVLCPLCRTGAPADTGPTRMTADDAARLRSLLHAQEEDPGRQAASCGAA